MIRTGPLWIVSLGLAVNAHAADSSIILQQQNQQNNLFIAGVAANTLYQLLSQGVPADPLPNGHLLEGGNVACATMAGSGGDSQAFCAINIQQEGFSTAETPSFLPAIASEEGKLDAKIKKETGEIELSIEGSVASKLYNIMSARANNDGLKVGKNILCKKQAETAVCRTVINQRGFADFPEAQLFSSFIHNTQSIHSTKTAKMQGVDFPFMPFRSLIRNPPSVNDEPFERIFTRMSGEKSLVMARQLEVLNRRYDLSDRPSSSDTMTRGKPLQQGVCVRLAPGLSWTALVDLTPEQIREKNLWPEGFLPLPHVNHNEGGMIFPKKHIEEILAQEGRDLNRFDVEFDLPEHFLAEFPAAIFLTTRPDLGDVSQGKLVTQANFFELFKDKLNPKQLDGLRLLVTPFPQQQFNHFNDRRSLKPHQGVSCFDCHSNGHTNNGTHLVGDRRPQEFRPRLDTPSLRGVHIQRLFGSQRSLRTIEDFTEFEQRAAYFDGDPVAAMRKGVNPLERGTQVHHMAEFQELLDFPPAPKLDVYGKLDPAQATEAELRGEKLFHGKAQCASCHTPPYYTDNLSHDLKLERFFNARQINGSMAFSEGRIKTFPLRGIKDSPPYLHDGRLLTLDDTVEFFNLVLQTHLTADEKADLVTFLKAL